jgi:ParB family chromosome partitioning protein
MAKRKSLGRGLDALLNPQSVPRQSAGSRGDRSDGLKEIPLDLLSRGTYQPRVDMREESLAELADSIRVQGVVQPIVVRPIERSGRDAAEQRYEIVAGERRWRAAQLAGLDKIPAVIKDVTDRAALAVSLIENIQRENLNPIEEASSLQRLVEEFGLTHSQAAEAVGRSRVTVTNLLRLLDLPDAVRAMVERRELSMGQARALLAVESPQALLSLSRRAAEKGWSVRETEAAVRRHNEGGGGKTRRKSKDPDVIRLEHDLSDRLGASVEIDHGKTGGRILIRYHNLDELDGIIEHIK